jgi:hypothetical protein
MLNVDQKMQLQQNITLPKVMHCFVTNILSALKFHEKVEG